MLELSNLSKTFNPGTVNAKLALDNLSLSVPDGDFISIIGANGAGKSTLFNAICGSFLTDTGTPARAQHRAAVPGSDARHRAGHEH